ncbi:retinol dehydrogenase [Colletotrichum truncatum]|uniref:Retinol dehydrogenase n=1 Tax=Colletotrichum truncatum TaxID=5467 RepID=A0ACC3YI52_COLTU|nr:retinol dehydrogenase [Colletotrichum truncatum]KAF6786077.1 retinol dehydrogenase [Colletotrichum truncatum]
MPCQKEDTAESTVTNNDFTEKDIPDLTGYVAIVTGGNNGIGYETTKQLALRNARVYIASRSESRVNEAISKINSEVGKSLDLHFLHMDLQDLKSVKAAAANFPDQRLDILINNAGVMNVPYKLTSDGYETQWQVNYLGPHIFTVGLLPKLLSTAAASDDKNRVRVIHVSSDLANNAPGAPKTIDFEDPNMSAANGTFALMQRYAHSKQAIIRDAKEINDRYSSQGVTAYSVHPGVVNTGLQSSDTTWMGSVMRTVMKVTNSTTPLQGSYNSLFAATSPNAPALQGKFLTPVAKVEKRAEASWLTQKEVNSDLWNKTEELARRF